MASMGLATMTLDADIRSRIQKLAKVRNRAPHCLLRDAISQYVEREERCEIMRQDTLRVWAAFRESGLHVTHAEADGWMAELETGHDLAPPECHE